MFDMGLLGNFFKSAKHEKEGEKQTLSFEVVENGGLRSWTYPCEHGKKGSFIPKYVDLYPSIDGARMVDGAPEHQETLSLISADTIKLHVVAENNSDLSFDLVDSGRNVYGHVLRNDLPLLGVNPGESIVCAVTKPPFNPEYVVLHAFQTEKGVMAEKDRYAQRRRARIAEDLGAEVPDSCEIMRFSVANDMFKGAKRQSKHTSQNACFKTKDKPESPVEGKSVALVFDGKTMFELKKGDSFYWNALNVLDREIVAASCEKRKCDDGSTRWAVTLAVK